MIRKPSNMYSLSCLLVLITVLAAESAVAFPPGPPRPPVGWEEWQRTGKYSDTVPIRVGSWIDRYGVRQDRIEVTFPAWGENTATLGARRIDSSKKPVAVWAECRPKASRQSSLLTVGCSGSLVGHQVTRGDVIPLFEHLYHVELQPGWIILLRVTEQVPEEFRPVEVSRTISLAQAAPDLFCDDNPRGGEYDVVANLKIDPVKRIASFELVPLVQRNLAATPKRKPLAGEISKGDVLAARGRAYRVLNVVPAQDIEGVGRLVGWIELSAEPVTPTEQDKIAALVELNHATWRPQEVVLPPSDEPQQLSPFLSRMLHNPVFLFLLFTSLVALLLVIYAIARRSKKGGGSRWRPTQQQSGG